MPKELVIPTDDPNVTKAFDPYSVQGMINALTFFARGIDTDVKPMPGLLGGKTYVMELGKVQVILAPTDSSLATKHVMVVSASPPAGSTLAIFNPDKVVYDRQDYMREAPIKFFARDPSAVLTIAMLGDSLEVVLKVTDIRHPERVHAGTITHII